MKKTITEVETAIENRIAKLEEEYELDIYDRNDIREEEYQKAGWRHDPFPEELEEEDDVHRRQVCAADGRYISVMLHPRQTPSRDPDGKRLDLTAPHRSDLAGQ